MEEFKKLSLFEKRNMAIEELGWDNNKRGECPVQPCHSNARKDDGRISHRIYQCILRKGARFK